ncbi:MAG TPA: hypothetical protein VN665_01770 [Candidatus Paceibacterota bacterium]|nr:hypothetical protein [Candidatus Paceibacterota bacterium]
MPTEKEVFAAGKVIHENGVGHGWFGPHYKKSFKELQNSDRIGFDEFLAIIHLALEAAQKARV